MDPYRRAAGVRLTQLLVFSKDSHCGGNTGSPCKQISWRLETPKKEGSMYHEDLKAD